MNKKLLALLLVGAIAAPLYAAPEDENSDGEKSKVVSNDNAQGDKADKKDDGSGVGGQSSLTIKRHRSSSPSSPSSSMSSRSNPELDNTEDELLAETAADTKTKRSRRRRAAASCNVPCHTASDISGKDTSAIRGFVDRYIVSAFWTRKIIDDECEAILHTAANPKEYAKLTNAQMAEVKAAQANMQAKRNLTGLAGIRAWNISKIALWLGFTKIVHSVLTEDTEDDFDDEDEA